MPTMPRPDNKLKKIVEKILGTPPNMLKEKKKPDTKVEKRLTYEETSRVR